jgi:epoxyqueuosine reductase QueG
MVAIFKQPLTADEIKAKARDLGADLVGIADGEMLERHPPDPADPQRPSDITELDGERVIVLAKRVNSGSTRIRAWNDRHKYYNDELALTMLEECSLELVYWLEDQGYPSIIVPPTHVDPWRYRGVPREHRTISLSLPHAAVEAGLGTLGLNLQLLTPEYGPRVVLTAVLCSVDVEPDRKMETALCLGPAACGRCLNACPGDVIGHWDRDWEGCDRYRSPHGFAQLTEQVERIMAEPDPSKQRDLIRSEASFNLWQSILRGAGVITGCRRCQDVCPVGADYAMLEDALEVIPEATAEKQARLDAMAAREAGGELPEAYTAQRRWIGDLANAKAAK